MFKNLNSMLFSFCLTMGVVMSISSINWISMWAGMEISFISFIPLISNKSMINSETCMKYFINQSMSSSIMMMGVIMISLNVNFDMLIIMSIMIKLGISPFHTWLLSMIEGMSFKSMILMFTIMKFPPFLALSYINMNMNTINIINMITSAWGGLNQNSFKKLMTYSSMFNMSMILISIEEYNTWLTFLMIYSIMITIMIKFMENLNMLFINQMILIHSNEYIKMNLWLMLMAMGGMPPMPMFMVKLMVINNLIENKEFLIILLIILFSLIIMFFYIRITIMSMMWFTLSSKWIILNKNKINSVMMSIMLTAVLLSMNLKSFF